MPGVAEAVVVAAPDDRLGERAAAVLRVRPGHDVPTLDEVRAHFKAAGLAKPEVARGAAPVDDFPRTASGKVQKFSRPRADPRAHCQRRQSGAKNTILTNWKKQISICLYSLSAKVDIPSGVRRRQPPVRARDALTKYLPERYKGAIDYVEVRGRTKIVVRGQISEYIPNPTFEVVARPGAQEDYFRTATPRARAAGRSSASRCGRSRRSASPAPRIELMDEQGIDRALMFPTLASLVEERMRDDPARSTPSSTP